MPSTSACPQSYALRLASPPDAEPAGEIEHVLSGERRRFASAAELLAGLQALQRQSAPAAPAAGAA